MAVSVLREKSRGLSMYSRTCRFLSRLADFIFDHFLGSFDGECNVIPVERYTGATYISDSTNTIACCFTLCLHLALCSFSRASRHSNDPSSQAAGLSIRPCSLSTKQRVLDMRSDQASEIEALQPLRCLRGNVRPPLSVDKQLRRKRQLQIFPRLATFTWHSRDLWRLPKLVDSPTVSQDRPDTSDILWFPLLRHTRRGHSSSERGWSVHCWSRYANGGDWWPSTRTASLPLLSYLGRYDDERIPEMGRLARRHSRWLRFQG